MHQLGIALFLLLLSLEAKALKISYWGETEIPYATSFKNTSVGGISGMFYNDGILYALSDDKGQKSPERFYEFKLNIEKNKVSLSPHEVRFISAVPHSGRTPFLDPEGFAILGPGEFLVSSEGNTDTKPRVPPRIFVINSQGKWLRDIPVPDKFIPEPLGKQTKGVQNNLSFEGLSASFDGLRFYVANEAPLEQDLFGESGEDLIRLIKYQKVSGKFHDVAEYAYKIGPLTVTDFGQEIFRGVSEVLYAGQEKLLVLERGVALGKSFKVQMTAYLYLVNMLEGGNMKELFSLSKGASFKVLPKKLLVDFQLLSRDKRKGKVTQNFEALTWGPDLPSGERSLLVMSDNNFSKNEKTELLVFSVKDLK